MSAIHAAPVTEAAATPVVVATHTAMAWLMGTTALAMLAYYFIGTDQGAVSVFAGAGVHEFVHDARHFLAFPCH